MNFQRLTLGLFASLWLGGCGPEGMRALPFAPFDAREVFSELQPGGPAASAAAAGGMSDFERQMMVGTAPEPSAKPMTGFQPIPIHDQIAVDMPVEFSEWVWAREGGLVTLTHAESGADADAFVVFQPIGTNELDKPVCGARMFQAIVDPGLADPMWVSCLVAANADLTPLLFTGYTSQRGTFSGWRWVGVNEHGLELRIARSQGIWRQGISAITALLQPYQSVVEELTGSLPGLEQLVGYVKETIEEEMSSATKSEQAASQILGSIHSREGLGVRFAMVCVRPACPVAEELAGLLNSARLERVTNAPAGQSDSLAQVRERLGLAYLSEVDLESIVDQAEALWESRGGAIAAGIEAAAEIPAALDATP